ncbi:nonsense-mediated mRNA decay factor SMG7-like [Lycorma delicatula]|uniref:nonsense-mediated mRNA decay factor SMG7-like n=1 Tax=Lycorma delicatula TaxID=130591 RepID=UPI003F513891
MGLKAAIQALKKADRLKEKVANSKDLLNDDEAWICQQQLQKIYQEVLIIDLEYALDKKVEQDLWNHGFKKYIGTLQQLAKNQKNPKVVNESQAMLSWCLDAASGFYLSLLQEICSAFDLDLPFRRKDAIYANFMRVRPVSFLNRPHKNSCYYICQHCLVHLGDIARYRSQSRQAEAFYRHAVQLSPNSGQPYNQLALLEASRGDRLSTVFHYVRSIAVRHMFPAATSNLTVTFEKCIDQKLNIEGRVKLTSSEYLTLFLKLHAMFHISSKMDDCANYVKLLTETLTAHIATQSFNSYKLVQMLAINIFAYHQANNDSQNENEVTGNEKQVCSLVTDLIAGSLNAFLLPVYTFKQEESLLDYFALPAIKLTMEWIKLEPHVLNEIGFSKRLQIWPGLCKLLNGLQASISQFINEKNVYTDIPLPEDRDLQGFLLLEKAFSNLNFSNREGDPKVLLKLRASRLLDLGDWLAELSRPRLITSRKSNGSNVYEAVGGTQVVPSTELLRELEELSLVKINVGTPSPVPSETPSSRASNATPELNNPAADLLAALESVQEKRAGILKPHALVDDTLGNNKSRVRQNVAMQAILRRSQEQETKQVTFRTPSPNISPSNVVMNRVSNDWHKNQNQNNLHSSPQFGSYPGPTSYHFAPPALDARFPPPPLFPPSNPWQEDKRQQSPWWVEENQAVSTIGHTQRSERPGASAVAPQSVTRCATQPGINFAPPPQIASASDLFGGVNWTVTAGGSSSVSGTTGSSGVGSDMKLGPFSALPPHPTHHPHGLYSHTHPPPLHHASQYSSIPSPTEHNSRQVESQQPNTFSPTYSLFSPAWAAHQPSAQTTSSGGGNAGASSSNSTLMAGGSSIIGQQSLWSGPGPSPLERLLEQQKQLREGPTPKGGT